MRKFTAAVCQMDSQDDKAANLETAGRLIRTAAAGGAQLAVLPETVNYIGHHMRRQAEKIPGETTAFLCETARECGIWLAGGSIQELCGEARPYNTMPVIGPDGSILCIYRKLHMFDASLESGGTYRESEKYTPGSRIVTAQTPLGILGPAICYDLRFPEMFRLMALSGAQVVCLAANFTDRTGEAHWEMLLRARAIENGVYMLASDQCGSKPEGMSHGHSMIVDPWGVVLARAGAGEDVIFAEIDPERILSVRRQVPAIENRRTDVYELKESGT